MLSHKTLRQFIGRLEMGLPFVVILIGALLCSHASAQTKFIHIFVALCDNEHQGIVPVPKSIGNGKNPATNLYWGAAFGVKTFFQRKATDWKLIGNFKPDTPEVLERLLFKNCEKDIYLLADAYNGEKIKTCIDGFLRAANGQNPLQVKNDSVLLNFGGSSDLLAYIGHNGLMDFQVSIDYLTSGKKMRDVIILACFSKSYFSPDIINAKAFPLLWTTNLMAPEAYTLKAAIDGWILNETGSQIKERAAQTYNQYQKCGLRGARALFITGFE